MDIPVAAPGTATVPWLVLGVVLGVLLVLLAGLTAALVVRRRAPETGVTAPEDDRQDDLPAFLESPPGTAASVPPAGWAALTGAPPVEPAPAPSPRARRDTVVVLLAMAVTALLLLGAAAAVAVASRPDGPRRTSAAAAADHEDIAARLTFAGVVLEPRAVGVTATYPVVEVSSTGGRARAHVEFPSFNCLTAEAPADPVAAGCARAQTQYAELSFPDLVVDRDGDALRITGRFPTEVRPNGSAPVPTGRAYELLITAAPADDGTGRGWQPAEGVLELGPGRAASVAGVSVLRLGS